MERHRLSPFARFGTTVDCGLWTVDCGLWTVDCGLWTVDCGLWKEHNRTTDKVHRERKES
ncbi:MAG: hypothetical protein DRP71_13600 [Verrucomicrobia bacterium]|nr:MAG: hypothetical protein DRP71_13600 [Verrucomicrobiota bacterium]